MKNERFFPFSLFFFLDGVWDKGGSVTVAVGTATFPVTKMVVVAGNIWCGTRNIIKVFVPETKEIKVQQIPPPPIFSI